MISNCKQFCSIYIIVIGNVIPSMAFIKKKSNVVIILELNEFSQINRFFFIDFFSIF